MALVASGRRITVKRNPCAVTVKEPVTDRAKRYRANQEGCLPSGKKACALCKSTRFLTVDHKDGDESNGEKSNLRWLCKSCNTKLGARDAKLGRGRRTAQYNPKGAPNLGAYVSALMVTKGFSDAMSLDDAVQLIHDTPAARRSEFASEIYARRREAGTAPKRPRSKKRRSAGSYSEEVPF